MKILYGKFVERWRYRISLILRIIFPDDLKNLDNCDVLLFCHDVDRPIDLNNKAYSPLLDSVREDLESRGLMCRSIAHVGSSLTGLKGYGEPVSFNRKYIWFRLMNKVVNLFGLTTRFEYDPYVYIIEKTGAKLIVTIGLPAELASAAKSKKIFHVELLHGIGYAFLPWEWSKLPPVYLPLGILSLDKTSTKSFSPLLEKGIEIKTIPHPFLKKFIPSNKLVQNEQWIPKLNSKKKYLKRVLVTLVWGYAGDHGPHIQFSNILGNGLFFDEIGELVREESNIFWHFRFHPVQLRMPRHNKLLKFMDNFVLSHPNSEWKEASRLPFPSIAMHCDGNIGMSSMSCYDAAAIGLPSIMLCPTLQKGSIHQDWFVDLENEGYVTKAKIDKEMLRSWVHKTYKLNPKLSNLDDDVAWEDAVQWMLKKSGLEDRIKCKDLK